jgi:hypothetical protein
MSNIMCSPVVITTVSPARGGSLPPQVVRSRWFWYVHSTPLVTLARPCSLVQYLDRWTGWWWWYQREPSTD